MHPVNHLVRRADFFFFGLLIFLLAGTCLCCINGKIHCFEELRTLRSGFLDQFFNGITWMGDGLCIILLSLGIVAIPRFRQIGLEIFIAFIVSAIAVQLLKRLFLAPRPKEYLVNGIYQFVPHGLLSSSWNSFPSGHTTSVFAMVTILALYSTCRVRGIALLLFGLLVGYSRIYLGQHFLEDVIAGSILGTITAIIVHLVLNNQRRISHSQALTMLGESRVSTMQ